jgi:galactofuranosylgalactofuranosylrhamnosyl-N-acetylglucosaminyl-diphospho-decaprenol beta-1,5/1,6-galactofuranosyltransferase
MMYRLQQLVMPNLTFGASEDMYARIWSDKVRVSFSERSINFKEGGRASFDTFFNSLTVGTWRKHCNLDDLYLVLTGKGKFSIRFGVHRIGHAHRWQEEQIIELEDGQEFSIALGFWSRLDSGMLYFSVEALDSAVLTGGYFATTTPPIRSVKLGIVITHFNRKQYVLPAIKRIREELLNDPLYKEKIELIVVDNSRNITLEEAEGVTLIPNKNLGGSGGFTRGLLHLKDEETFTHCLFMDDDASCEVESIRRTVALLAYSQTSNFAVAGSMLRELEPHRLFEKGAKFDGACRPLKGGMNMQDVNDLLMAELIDEKPDYGGWWFFAYALKDVKSFAFPFFVRGDDSMFSIANQFDICTLNGITTWGDDFALKSGPLPTYLDTRYHLLHSMLLLSKSRILCSKIAFQFMLGQLLSYNYASASAVRLAIQHLQMGPKFWLENMDTSEVRAQIGVFAGSEKLAPVDRATFNVGYRHPVETVFRRLGRVFTLNGFLLPSFLLKDDVAFQHKGFRGSFREVFRYKKVLYEYEPTGMGYIAEHNKKKFFGELALFSWQMVKFIVRFSALKREYQQALPDMTNESFWRKVYKAKE